VKATRLGYKWELLVILWAAYFLKQGAWQIYGAVLPLIKADLKLSDVRLGLVATLFTFVLAACAPLGGILGDFFSKKWIVSIALLTFGVGTFLTGLSGSLLTLVVFRAVVTGVGLGLYYPAANTLIGQYHSETRGQAMSFWLRSRPRYGCATSAGIPR
jgi:MFS family permease